MELRTKLRFTAGLSILALIFKIVVFVSPGWVVVNQEIEVHPKDMILPQDDGLHADSPLEEMAPVKHRYWISFGIWYYKVCMRTVEHDKNGDSSSSEEDSSSSEENSSKESDERKHHKRHRRHHHHHKCYHACYRHRHEHVDPIDKVFDEDDIRKDDPAQIVDKKTSKRDMPTEFEPAREFITTAVGFANYGRHAFACYAVIGVILGLVGIIGAIVYTRSGGMGKHSGRLACSTQFLSSFFYWLCIISVTSYIIQLLVVRDERLMDGEISKDTGFVVPWCLVLGGFGALIMDISALFHMILISRDRSSDGRRYSFRVETGKTPIISQMYGNQLVFPYLQMTDEAGPLPEKQPIS